MTKFTLSFPGGIDVGAEGDLPGYLASRIAYLKGVWSQLPGALDFGQRGPVPIKTVREKLAAAPPLRKATQLTVSGTFFPAVLLYAGWWERLRQDPRKKPEWHDDLQAWLFAGFEQWGPSWDFSVEGSEESGNYLFGQIGEGDEANSLPVIVPPSKAERIYEQISGGKRVFDVRATGSLCHRTHLVDKEVRQKADEWGETFDYFILLDEDNPAHHVSPLAGRPVMYSGYLWQCFAPSKWIIKQRAEGLGREAFVIERPRLNKVYFIWEHTDFTKPDAVEYNLDSLERKRDFLKARVDDDLVLLQKSSEVVPGRPILDRKTFYEYVTE
jgi:hypothetical protein